MSKSPNFELELTKSLCCEYGLSPQISEDSNAIEKFKYDAEEFINDYSLPESRDVEVVSKWTDDEKKNEISNMIVCIRSGESYDPIFQKVQPNIPNGRAIIYLITFKAASDLLEALETKKPKDNILDIYNYIETLKAEDIAFYFECCGGCSVVCSKSYNTDYSIGKDNVKLIAHLVRKKNIMVMCADFSLKGLIKDWDDKLLGPNPFTKIGETSSKFTLNFDINTLKECKSTQMQSLGKLVETGTVDVRAMSGTIVYTVDSKETEEYVTQVLTVARTSSTNNEDLCTTCDGNHTGHAGQVMLHYKDAGILMVSNGHFAELARLDVSLEKFLRYTATEYGKEKAEQYSQSMNSMTDEQCADFIRTTSARMVSSDVPCLRTVSQPYLKESEMKLNKSKSQ